MKKTIILITLLCTLAIFAGGCGTYRNHTVFPTYPYGGILYDKVALNGIQRQYDHYPTEELREATHFYYWDMPFSFIGDTVMLPLDIILWICGSPTLFPGPPNDPQ